MKIAYLINLVIVILLSSCYPIKKTIRLNNSTPKDNEYIILKNNIINIYIYKDNLLKKLTEKKDAIFKERIINYLDNNQTLSLPESNMDIKSEEMAYVFYFTYNEILKGNAKIVYKNKNIKTVTYNKIKGDLGSVHSYFQYENIIFLRYLHSLGE